MPTTRIRITGLVDVVTRSANDNLEEAWLLVPNATDPDEVAQALGYSTNVVGFHEPRLVLDPQSLTSEAPRDLLKKGLKCHPEGWSYIDLCYQHLEVGGESDSGPAVDATFSSVIDLDAVVNTVCSIKDHRARVSSSLFTESYSSNGSYSPMICRARLRTGTLAGGELYKDGEGNDRLVGFFNAKHRPRKAAREVLVKIGGQLSIRCRALDDEYDAGTILTFTPGAEIRFENAGACNGRDESDFVGHFLLRDWPVDENGSPTTGHPFPDTGGDPGDNPQCSPASGERP